MIRCDSLRASASWRWYSSRTRWASDFVRSASSRLSRMRCVRPSIAFFTAGKAKRYMRTKSTMKAKPA
jgi:hypothetical protein